MWRGWPIYDFFTRVCITIWMFIFVWTGLYQFRIASPMHLFSMSIPYIVYWYQQRLINKYLPKRNRMREKIENEKQKYKDCAKATKINKKYVYICIENNN